MDIYEVLREDHLELLRLCEAVHETQEPQRRWERFVLLRRRIDIHTEAEGRLFYPRFQEDELYRQDAFAAVAEHDTIEERLEELERLPVDEDRWLVFFTAMEALLRAHLRHEERDLFPKARMIIADEEAAPLGERVHAFEQQAL